MKKAFFKINLIVSILFLFQHVRSQTTKPLFESLSPSKSNIDFVNSPISKPGLNMFNYFYYYNGGGVAIGDINNDGLSDIYFTANNNAGNKLFLNKGDFVFEDITKNAGVAGTVDWSSGVTMADVNADGFLDIYVSVVTDSFGLTGENQLYINNGNNTFTDKAKEYGLNIRGFTSQVAFFDYDHDGDLDCFTLSQSIIETQFLRNGRERRKSVVPFFKSRMLRNELNKGNTMFTDVSTFAGIYQSDIGFGLGIAVSDINNDGWEDVYIGNDFSEKDYYYVNNGDGTFSESGEQAFNHFSYFSMGVDIADYNNDGQLDIITVDMLQEDEKRLKSQATIINEYYVYKQTNTKEGYNEQFVKNCLHTNNGNGKSFSETSLMAGISATGWSWAPLFADFDNDGKKDIVITSGIPKAVMDLDFIFYSKNENLVEMDLKSMEIFKNLPTQFSHPYFFKGDGNTNFKDVSDVWGLEKIEGALNGTAYGDLDNDGDLDVIINSNNDTAIVLKNNSTNKNNVSFTFKNNSLNTHAIGAKVYVYADNQIQYQQLMPTRGFQSSVEPRLHFGLDTITTIDSVLIVWPDQKMLKLKDIKINQLHLIEDEDNRKDFIYDNMFPSKEDQYEDITDKIFCDWKHKENSIDDFNTQRLIPQAKSTRGPKIAIADVNKDGFEDFYACGSGNQPGTLFVQNKSGEFIKTNTSLFISDSVYEDVDAIFFDADNDGDQDLFVVSGGNMFVLGDKNLLDRLYLNDGKGFFTKAVEAIPLIFKDESSVASMDIDNDGDLDLFVGNFLNPEAYGEIDTSYVLINDGKAKFTLVNRFFNNIGMVTDVKLGDVNNDNIKDIIVVGEWMPITIFLVSKKGELVKKIIPNSTGLWQSVFIDDINNDGNNDLLLGNWGFNTKFWSNKTSPLRLYVGDFNKNGREEQILTYVYKGEEYTFMGKQLLEQSLPLLKKKYLLYNDFAGVPFQNIFIEMVKDARPLKAERLGSVVCFGNGKGEFTIEDLPMNLQQAPINVIQKTLNKNEYLFGGNMFATTRHEGRYDAQPLVLAFYLNGTFNRKQQSNFNAIKGQVKDLKWINNVKYGKILIIARNDEMLLFYKPKTKKKK